jgi:uncharacterized protein (UPF0332 family)
MGLAHKLLEHAEGLLPQRRGRPDQAALRRAVSAAYYAAFHRLVERSTDIVAGVSAEKALRHVIGRSFEHGSMRDLSGALLNQSLPEILVGLMGEVPDDLRTIARDFPRLQSERHRADYNLAQPFSKHDVQLALRSARRIFEALDDTRAPSKQLRHFLMILPMWAQLRRRA